MHFNLFIKDNTKIGLKIPTREVCFAIVDRDLDIN